MRKLPLVALLALAASPAFAAEVAPSMVPAAQLPVADHLVFLNELPESADLMKDAAANGLTIKRLDRTSDRVVVIYAYPNGQISTIGYALLSAVGNGDWVAPEPARVTRVVEERPVTVVAREPEILYYEPSYTRTRYVYRDPVDSFWLPMTFGLGLGWATGHNHYDYHNHYHRGYPGYHGGYRSHGRGGGRR